MDLTKIDQPFGTLDIETKLALCHAFFDGKVIEQKSRIDGKWTVIDPPFFLLRGVYRLRPEPLRDISLPWAALDARWQWAARDADGDVCVYENEPRDAGIAVWAVKGAYLRVNGVIAFDPGNKLWNESLIRRPEGV